QSISQFGCSHAPKPASSRLRMRVTLVALRKIRLGAYALQEKQVMIVVRLPKPSECFRTPAREKAASSQWGDNTTTAGARQPCVSKVKRFIDPQTQVLRECRLSLRERRSFAPRKTTPPTCAAPPFSKSA